MKKNQLSFLFLVSIMSFSSAYAVRTGNKNTELDAVLKICKLQQAASGDQFQNIQEYQNKLLDNLELTLAGIKDYSQKLNAQKKRLSDYSDHAKQLHSDVNRLEIALIAAGSTQVKKFAESHIYEFEGQLQQLNDAATQIEVLTSQPTEIPSAEALREAIDLLKKELRALVFIDKNYAGHLKGIAHQLMGKTIEVDDGGLPIQNNE